jgi:hypothetical protein
MPSIVNIKLEMATAETKYIQLITMITFRTVHSSLSGISGRSSPQVRLLIHLFLFLLKMSLENGAVLLAPVPLPV